MTASDLTMSQEPVRGPSAGSEAPRDQWLGRVLPGSYRLVRKLGQGGMGVVYEAHQPDGPRVAVKLLREDNLHAHALQRLLREARVLRTITHPHVVRMLDAQQTEAHEARPFLVMELLVGLDLEAHLRTHGPLRPEVATRLFQQAASGLAVMHAGGLVHRDVKPANLFLHEASGQVTVKVCDLGLARRMEELGQEAGTLDLTQSHALLGSPIYMSPEQVSDARALDARSDLWSLSLSLYAALTGQRPWTHCSTLGQLMVAICTQELVPLGRLAPWVAPELADVVHRGLRRDPALRWSSCEEFIEALAPFACPEEVTAARAVASPEQARARALEPSDLTQSAPAEVASATVAGRPLPSALALAPVSLGPSAPGFPEASPPRPPGPRRARWSLIVLAAVALAGVGLLRRPPSGATLAVPVPPQAPSGSRRVSLRVTPAQARVHVNGQSLTPDVDGVLALTGEVGESFVVELSEGERTVRERVVISREGMAIPATLSLPPAAPLLLPSPAVAAPAVSAARLRPGPPPGAREPAAPIGPTPSPATSSPPPAPKMHADL